MPIVTTVQHSVTTTTRTEVVAEHGVVAAGHPTVAEVGVRVLEGGGNALDAVIAATFAAFVVEPANCGLGGHGRISIHMADSGKTIGIDHFIRAPVRATSDMFQKAIARRLDQGGPATEDAVRTTGHLSVGIPGTVAGLCEAHRLCGTRPLTELLAPAIDLAEAGLPVTWHVALHILSRATEIQAYPETAALLMPGGLPPGFARGTAGGPRLDFWDMARTMKRIAVEGPAAFYLGEIAEAIELEMAANGGLLTAADLAGYSPDVFIQPRYSYRNYDYVTCGDLIGVETLNLLEQFDVPGCDPDGVTYRHLMGEALGQAFVDNFAFFGDPKHVPTPTQGLASKTYAAHLAGRIALDQAQSEITPGDPWAFNEHEGSSSQSPGVAPFTGTTQICAADQHGNVVSLITSLGSAFGSLVLVPGTGIILGNAMQWFDPQPGKVNSVGPGRMPLYGAPVLIAFKEGRAVGAIAGSGGYRIPTAILHTFVNVVDHGMAVQSAIEAPCVHCQGQALHVDSRIPPAIRDELRAMGHKVVAEEVLPVSFPFGRPSAVWRDDAGYLHAASDVFSGGTAGY